MGQNLWFPLVKMPQSSITSFNLKSFREALQGKIPFKSSHVGITHSIVKGSPTILISDADLDKLIELYALTLLGEFTFCRPNMDCIREFFHSSKLVGSYAIGLINSGHILIKF